jgi:hypothetical protein
MGAKGETARPSSREPPGARRGRGRVSPGGLALAGIAAAALVIALFLVLPAGTPRRAAAHTPEAPTTSTTTTVPPTTTTTTTDPGTLPQTDTFPSADSPQFQAEMAALWSGVVTGSVESALPAFFPESAYAQVKAIADPGADWQDRLVGEFSEDLAAAHGLLGTDGATATFVGVTVPSAYGHWVDPGVCENRVGYYEVPNSRVVYQEDGQTRSFGIASMISWRGEWYVVHLGAVVRSSDQGLVDDPEVGPGISAASTTC